MKNLLLGLMLLFAFSAIAQDPSLPIDFNDPADDAFVGEGGAVYSLESLLFTPEVVGKIVGGSDQWNSRVDLALGTYIDMTTPNKTFTFDYFTTTTDVMTGLFQISNEASGGYAIEMQFTTDGLVGWQTITLDFIGATNAYPNAGEPVVYGNYAQLSIFTDFGFTTTGTYYFDDIAGAANGGVVLADPGPTVTAPIPTEAQDDVISVFSDVYTDLATTWHPAWGQTTIYSDEIIPGTIPEDHVSKLKNFGYEGITFASTDLTLMENVHFDVWSYDETSIKFFLLAGGPEPFITETLSTEQWNSFDVPLANFIGGDLSIVTGIKLESGTYTWPNGTSLVYIDNIYFWKEPAGSGTDATLSDLQVDGNTVAGFLPSTLSYDVELPYGTTIVPTVTATTNDPAASHVVIPAASLPGTTTVDVTAADLVTSQTYSVNFSVAAPPQPTHNIDFEFPFGIGADWFWEVSENDDNPPLEIIPNPVSGGINTSFTVAKFTARLTGNPWALCFTDDNGQFTFDASNSTVTMMVNKPVISDVGLKVEGASGDHQIIIPNTQINQWEELTFDFSGQIGNTYTRLIIIPDFDLTPRAQENICYFDNIQIPDGIAVTLSDLQVDGSTITDFKPIVYDYAIETTSVPTVTATTTDPAATYVVNNAASVPGTTTVVVTGSDAVTTRTYTIDLILEIPEPATAAPDPTEAPEDVFSIYSDSYTDLANTNFYPGWGQSTVVTYESIGGNNTLKYSGLNFQGTNLGSLNGGVPQDVSGYEYLHVDFWTPNASALNFFIIDQSPGEVFYALPITTEEWVSVDIPLSHFSNGGEDLTDIHQFKVDGGDGTTTQVWFDNWYFGGSAGIRLDLTAFLEGPYSPIAEAGNMLTDLNSGGYIPTSQPYNPGTPYYGNDTPVWFYAGAETADPIPSVNVVDWVLVQLRDADAPVNATSATILSTQAALLMNDGKVVGLDGTSMLTFDVTVSQNLYAVVFHRNHLGIMSKNALTDGGGGIYTYDFSSGETQVYGDAAGHKDLGAGVWGMIAADGDADGSVLPSDKTSVWLPDANLTGYRGGDYNLNGIGQPDDVTNLWLPNANKAGQIPGAKGEVTKGYQSQIPQ